MRKWRLYRKKIYIFLLSICLFMLTSRTTYVDNKVKAEDLLDTVELKEMIEVSSSYIDAKDVPQVYEQQVIKIYHQKQLEAIGTNAFVRSFDMEEERFGIGDIIQEDKQELKYTSQATYQLMNDIQIMSTWRLPINFTGTFVRQEDCDKKLYEDGRIYIHHQKQLDAIGSNIPVLDQDINIQTFGSGKVVLVDDIPLVYDRNRKYILHSCFEIQERQEQDIQDETILNHLPQQEMYVTEDQTTIDAIAKGKAYDGEYILIYNEAQLRTIGHMFEKLIGGNGVLQKDYSYVHDADTKLTNGKPIEHATDDGIVGLGGYNKKYTPNAKYKIVKDIMLSNGSWIPLDFYGEIYGAKDGISGMSVTIQNVNVKTAGEKGTGFFGYVASSTNKKQGVLSHLHTRLELKPVIIKNITLDQVSVQNPNTEGMNQTKPMHNATGAFAGQISGYVIIQNCHVKNASIVHGHASYVGGFVGRVTGGTTYDILSATLDSVSGGLGGLLNNLLGWLIPVDDIVDAIVKDGLGIHQLLPVKYDPAVIENSTISFTNTTGSQVQGKAYVGGFVGRGEGVRLQNTHVSQLQNIQGNQNVGGFVGRLNNATIIGLLEGLGVKLVNFPAHSSIENSYVSGSQLQVTASVDGFYLGGMVGAFSGGVAASDITSSYASGIMLIQGDGDHVGGFAGTTDIGDLVETTNLLGGIGNLIGGVLGNDPDANLLRLIGVRPSVLCYTQVIGESDGYRVLSKGSKVGGFVGSSIGSIIQGQYDEQGVFIDDTQSHAKNLKLVQGLSEVGGFLGKGNLGSTAGILEISAGAYQRFTVRDAKVTPVLDGLQVVANSYHAGGAIGYAGGGDVTNLTVENLLYVEASNYAGGFAGKITSGNVAETKGLNILGLVAMEDLLHVVEAIQTKVAQVQIVGAPAGLSISAIADDGIAGGFLAEMLSGDIYASMVSKVKEVMGNGCAGGFIGKATAASIASSDHTEDEAAFNKLLGLDIGELLQIMPDFVPTIRDSAVSGISADYGYRVISLKDEDVNAEQGSSGGFIGYGAGVQVRNSDALYLAYVQGNRYAGGFIGFMDIGSTAGIGYASILNKLVNVGNVLRVLDSVVSTITECNVEGMQLGYESISNKSIDTTLDTGTAGGFVGRIAGGHIQTSHALHMKKIYGSEYAGGYVGALVPGDLAKIGDVSILGGLVDLHAGALQIAQTMVPTIKNSYAQGVLCGVEVIADGTTPVGETVERGIAGGYVGLNTGGHIWGKGDNNFTMISSEIHRLRLVKGAEYAGGYVGVLKVGSLLQNGGIKILFDAIALPNVLEGLSVIIPIHEQTGVSGPLSNLSEEEKAFLVVNGINVQSPYGYQVIATDTNRNTYVGIAGGYVGLMRGGIIKDSTSHDVLSVQAKRASGGFVGEMSTGALADVGVDESGKLLGKLINSASDLVSAGEVIVPSIQQSSTIGYVSGATIKAFGITDVEETSAVQGIAGGFVGLLSGGRIIGTNLQPCKADKLRRVEGTRDVGGFAGYSGPADFVNISGGSLLFDFLRIREQLISVLEISVPVIRFAQVYAVDDWGLEVESIDDGRSAGGFMGYIQGSQIGRQPLLDTQESEQRNVFVHGLRKVSAGYYAGGFFGYADASDIVSVDREGLDILSILAVSQVEALEIVRTHIHHAEVIGISDGFHVIATKQTSWDVGNREASHAGGFGGLLQAGATNDCQVTSLYEVKAPNFAGGFIARFGSSGIVEVGKIQELGLLSFNIGVGDLFGSYATQSSVRGVENGFYVKATYGQHAWAGGFSAYADVGQFQDDQVEHLKEVSSTGIAGGFLAEVNNKQLLNLGIERIPGFDFQLHANLIDANRTKIIRAKVSGISKGYDVFAGASHAQQFAIHENGAAGGFIGWNHGGSIEDSQMVRADTVKGSKGITSFFEGKTDDSTLWLKAKQVSNAYELYRGSVQDTTGEIRVRQDVFSGVQDTIVGGVKFDITNVITATTYRNSQYFKEADISLDGHIFVLLDAYISDQEVDMMKVEPLASTQNDIQFVIQVQNDKQELMDVDGLSLLVTLTSTNGFQQTFYINNKESYHILNVANGQYDLIIRPISGFRYKGYRRNTEEITYGSLELNQQQKDKITIILEKEDIGNHRQYTQSKINHIEIDLSKPEDMKDSCESLYSMCVWKGN